MSNDIPNQFEDEPLPSPDKVVQGRGETEQLLHVDELAVAQDDVTPLNEQDNEQDFDDLRIPGADAPAQEAAPVKRAEVREYVPEIYHPNVTATDQELKPTAKENLDPALELCSTTPSDLSNQLAALDGDEVGKSADLRDWLGRLDESTILSHQKPLLMRAQTREGSRWGQELRGQHYFIKPAYKSVSPSDIKPEMSGSTAVDLFIQGNAMGRTVRWPLYRSGIWVNIRPASLTYLAEIDRSLVFERAQVGMDTSGLFNSNDSLIFDDKLIDAALRLVTWCNVQVGSVMELRSLITFNDIPSLIAAMAAATFADGAGASVTCSDHKCRNVDLFDADVRRMSWVDQSRYTDDQIKFMDEVTAKHTVEQVREYQKSFEVNERGTYTYNGRVFNFGIGSADNYFELGYQWIAQINRALTEAMGEADIENGKRSRIIQSILTSETLCRYGHYITSISIPAKDGNSDDTMVSVTDRDTINNILRMLLTDDDGAEKLLAAIEDYIVETESVIIGYRNVACTKCGKYHLDDRGQARLIIPFKVGKAFFTLLQHRLVTAGIPAMTDLETSGIRAFVLGVSEAELRSFLMEQQRADI